MPRDEIDELGIAGMAARLIVRPAREGVFEKVAGYRMALRNRKEFLPEARMQFPARLVERPGKPMHRRLRVYAVLKLLLGEVENESKLSKSGRFLSFINNDIIGSERRRHGAWCNKAFQIGRAHV